MALILKLDLDMVKMYHHSKNEISMSTAPQVVAHLDRQTDTDTQIHTSRQPDTHRHYENYLFRIRGK